MKKRDEANWDFWFILKKIVQLKIVIQIFYMSLIKKKFYERNEGFKSF